MSNKALFILGGPGSGKDYVINNILNRFNIVEVQIDQLLSGVANRLIESGANLLINSNADMTKIELAKSMLEGYTFSHTIVSVSNKISRERNDSRIKPMNEATRIRKWLDAENMAMKLENFFVFTNSINLSESTASDLQLFREQIAKYLGFLLENGLQEVIGTTAAKEERKRVKRHMYLHHVNKEHTKLASEDTTAQPATLDTKPLSKKKKIIPPNSINMRIDGSGGYSLGGLTVAENKLRNKFSDWKKRK